MARSKRTTGDKRKLPDFILILSTLSNLYEEQEDAGRAKSFKVASENLSKFADLTGKSHAVLKSSKDFKDVKGVGKSTLEMMDEFIETGKCARLEELLEDESNMSFDEILEKREEERKKELLAMPEPTDKETAKAFCMIEHKYMEQKKNQAKKLIKEMDTPMRVLVAQLLLEDDYLPYHEQDAVLCYHCDLVRSEDHSGDCNCYKLDALKYAEKLGCKDLPEITEEEW